MSGESVRRFVARMQAESDARYEPGKAYAELVVTAVEKDSAGGTLAARGTIDGAGEDTVPMRGVSSTQVGDRLLIAYDKGEPAGPKTYVRHIASANPAPQIDVNPDLPDPQFAEPPFISVLIASPGSITSSLTIKFLAVEDRFFPEGYTASYRLAGGEWGEGGFVPHTGGVQESRLGQDFPPGSFVDVRLRAHYARNTSQSPGLDTRTFQTAVDDVSPGLASALAVSVATPGALVLTAGGVVNDHFAGWLYEIATSPGGATIASAVVNGPFTWSHAPGTFYAKVTPVSKTGVPGSPFPGSGHAGPFTIADFAPPLDVTPPPTWAAPVLSGSVNQPANGGEQYWLTVTLPISPAYGYPADYAYTLVRVSGSGGASYGEERIQQGQAFTTMQVLGGVLLSVTLQGVDRLGNSSTASPAATITIAVTGVPTAAPVISAETYALATKISWNAVTAALAYEVERAPNVGGSPGTFARVATVDGRAWLDTLTDETVVLPIHWYRVRAVNLAGGGPYSNQVSQTTAAVDASNLRLNSITAAQVAADSAIFNKIVVLGTIISNNLLTAAVGNSRLELRGQTASNPNQLRAIELVSGIERLRMLLDGAGLSLYDDAAVVAMALTKAGLQFNDPAGVWALRTGQAGGVGYLESAGGFRIRGDYTWLDMTNQQQMVWDFTQPDAAGTHYHILALRRLHSSSTASAGIGLVGYQQIGAASPVVPKFYLGFSTANPATGSNMPTEYVLFAGGQITATGTITAQGGAIFLGNAGKSWAYNATAAAMDCDAPVRRANPDGSAYKIDHGGVGGNATLDNSHGVVYMGWATNPGQFHYFGKGGGNYGSIACDVIYRNSELVPSDRRIKEDIRPLGGERVTPSLRRVGVHRFRYRHDDEGRERVGVLADDVEAALGAGFVRDAPVPNAVEIGPDGRARLTDRPHPDWVDGDGRPLKAVDQTMLAMLTLRAVQEADERADAAEARADALAAQLAALAGRVAAMEGGAGKARAAQA